MSRNKGRGQIKCDGTRAETRFRLSTKRTSPFKSAGASVQSTTGSRGVRISGSNAVYTMFRGSVKSTGYPLHSPVSPSLPLPCVTVYHHISTTMTHFAISCVELSGLHKFLGFHVECYGNNSLLGSSAQDNVCAMFWRRNVLSELPSEPNSITRNVLSYMVKEPRRISVERSIILRFKYDGV
jgi:hypothetical protein